MLNILRSRATLIWVILVGLTVISLESFRQLELGLNHRPGAVAVILIAFLKVRIVGLEYMELRTAPTALRLAFEAWMTLILSIILYTIIGG